MPTCGNCGMNYPNQALHYCLGQDVSKPKFIVGSVFEVMRDMKKNPELYSELLAEFRLENGLEKGYLLTPELKAKLADKITKYIMEKAKEVE